MESLFETILEHIPAPGMDPNGTLQFQLALLDYNDYVGRIGIGRIVRGTINVATNGFNLTFRWNNSTIPYHKIIWILRIKTC